MRSRVVVRSFAESEVLLSSPIWCHHHGAKMQVVQFNQEEHRLVIAGSAAKVTIRHGSQIQEGGDVWVVDWEVTHAHDEVVRGRRRFEKHELLAAFGLTAHSGNFGQWLLERFGADSAEQGKYIRWRHFLNIPGPGTGHDGDPNVSIHIDDGIREVVRQLLV